MKNNKIKQNLMCIFILLSFSPMMTAKASLRVNNEKIYIENEHPALYVFCSKKQSSLELERIEFERSASAGWSTRIPPFACAVLFTEQTKLTFSCQTHVENQWVNVNCADYLLSSRFPWEGGLLSKQPPQGSFWVAEGVTPDEVPVILRRQQFDV